MAPVSAPCSWDPIPCGCELPGYGENEEPEEGSSTQYAVETAAYVLWALSGRQFGTCEQTFRPCRRDCGSGLEGSSWGARLVGGQWVNLPCRGCSGSCSCSEVCEVRVPVTPVYEVLEVVMDGAVLDEEFYRLEDSAWLVLSAGCFPSCQDMSLPFGDEGTWGVRYKWGTPPPVAGRRAVGSLACEILKACRGETCGLPKRTVSVSSQGVAYAMIDPMEFFDVNDAGRTGLFEVDIFLKASNPFGRTAGARVMSPDSAPRVRGGYEA